MCPYVIFGCFIFYVISGSVCQVLRRKTKQTNPKKPYWNGDWNFLELLDLFWETCNFIIFLSFYGLHFSCFIMLSRTPMHTELSRWHSLTLILFLFCTLKRMLLVFSIKYELDNFFSFFLK